MTEKVFDKFNDALLAIIERVIKGEATPKELQLLAEIAKKDKYF